MQKYSKVIAAVVGFAASIGLTYGVLPEEYATPEAQATVTGILVSVFVYFAPANSD